MPKIGNSKASHEKLCERCGSKRRVGKTWTEKFKNDSGNIMILQHTQVVCTNKECQAAFDKFLNEENAKREKLKQDRSDLAAKKMGTKTAS